VGARARARRAGRPRAERRGHDVVRTGGGASRVADVRLPGPDELPAQRRRRHVVLRRRPAARPRRTSPRRRRWSCRCGRARARG
jgi:hypothetical protein